MNSKIVIINGPAGVGKTTISKKLAEFGENSACIHGDDFKGYIINRKMDSVESGLGYKNGAAVTTNFVNGGYDLVIFEYVFEDAAYLPKFIDNLSVECPVYLFTLWTDQNTVVDRERKREGRERLGSRVLECYSTMNSGLDKLGLIIDTTDKLPDDIAYSIWNKIKGGEGAIANLPLHNDREGPATVNNSTF